MSEAKDEVEIITVPVAIRIDRLERMVGRGSLRALVHVTLDVGDLEMRVHGLQITHDHTGWMCKSPQYRDGNGIWRQCFGLPQSIFNATWSWLPMRWRISAIRDYRQRRDCNSLARYGKRITISMVYGGHAHGWGGTLDRSARSMKIVTVRLKK